MKKIATLAAGAALTIAVSATPAEAHNPNVLAFIACAWDRPNTDHVVDHSHPFFLNEFVLLINCESHDVDTRCRYVAAMWRGGLITGPYPPGGSCKEIPE